MTTNFVFGVLVCSAGLAGLVLVIVFLWPGEADGVRTNDFNAGPAESFAPGSIRYFEARHVYIVRRGDRTFVALYDWDAWGQTLYAAGDRDKEACRVEVLSPASEVCESDLSAVRRKYPPEPGLEDVVLRSGCDGSFFDALGRRAFGPAATDLDRFEVSIDGGGRLIVDLAQRQCLDGSPCLPWR